MIEAIDVHKSFNAGVGTVEALRGVTFRLPKLDLNPGARRLSLPCRWAAG